MSVPRPLLWAEATDELIASVIVSPRTDDEGAPTAWIIERQDAKVRIHKAFKGVPK